MTESVECLVVGAGAIGLAVARALALRGREVVIAEAESRIGSHTSSRNSEVIHAGIYYPVASLKARTCVAGRRMLYKYCADRQIPCERIGKLIVATSARELEQLAGYQARAIANGVDDLVMLDADAVREREPAIRCAAGLWSPATGIFDSHAYLLALQADLESAGGSIALGSRIGETRAVGDGFEVTLEDVEPQRFRCRYFVNAGGLFAPALARRIAGLDERHVPGQFFAKGHYFGYSGALPFRHLVYPVAEAGGLGIHVTRDMSGGFRFGPDVEWVNTLDYAFDDARRPAFAAAIRSYFPGVDEDRLVPGYTGIRPKITGPGEPAADFVIQGPSEHGVAGLVNLFGIESPGLTASLALAELAADVLLQTG